MGEMNGYGYGAGLGFLQTLGVIRTARTTLHSFSPTTRVERRRQSQTEARAMAGRIEPVSLDLGIDLPTVFQQLGTLGTVSPDLGGFSTFM